MNKKYFHFFTLLYISLLIALSVLIINSFIIKNKEIEYKCPDCNVILISIDTLRADHLGVYGYKKNISPNIDNFAKKAIIFEKSYSQSHVTAPSHMSIMTSLYPSLHGICNFEETSNLCNNGLDKNITTLAQILKSFNYSTIAFTGGGHVSDLLGFNKGFDIYNNHNFIYDNLELNESYNPFDILKKLTNNTKFFLFFHTYKVHDPYFPSEQTINKFCKNYNRTVIDSYKKLNVEVIAKLQEYPNSEFSQDVFDQLEIIIQYTNNSNLSQELTYYLSLNFSKENILNISRIFEKYYANGNLIKLPTVIRRELVFDFSEKDLKYLKCLYDSEIYEMDLVLGRLFYWLNKSKYSNNTIIVFTSDHGEEFFDHGDFLHEKYYNEIINVPLIMKIPRFNNKRISLIVRSIDIFPTILDVLGINQEIKIEGVSLISIIKGKRPKLIVYSELPTLAKFSVIDKGYKLLSHNEEIFLFNIIDDPLEQKNLATSHPKITKRLMLQVNEHFDLNLKKRYQKEHRKLDIDDEIIEQLKSLGYI